MAKVGITKFTDDKWVSVSATYDFYRRALSSSFDLIEISQNDLVSVSHELDAIVNFRGSRAYLERERIACPVLYGMHGGLVVDHKFVSENISKLRTGDTLLVNCTSDIEIVHSLTGDQSPRTVFLPLPVETASEIDNLKFECRRVLGIESTDLVLGFVARLLPAKNLHGFLRILAQVQKILSPKRVRALIVGNYWLDYPILAYCTSDYPRYIKQLIDELDIGESLIYFPASLTRDELRTVYGAMDLLVHPTYGIDENFGYVAVEAMGQGVPVVAAAYGGLKDTIRSGVTGHLMATWATSGGIRMDVAEGVARIVELLRRPSQRNDMAQSAWLHAAHSYSEPTCTQILVAAIKDAISGRQGCFPVRSHSRAEPSPLYPRSSSLPPIKNGWLDFDQPVSHYVSTQMPQLRNGDILTPAGPIYWQKELAHLDEPAWPISEAMDYQARAFLDDLAHQSCEVRGGDWPLLEIAQSLVSRGWLSVHRNEES
ncbi:glycosyltransferase [Sinorhizobium medicae]|nr:glycosyltransferase [Sinorhizobium medicae]